MLKHRILTAIILIPLFLAAVIFLPPFGFSLFTAAITLGAAWEWCGLMNEQHTADRIAYVLFIGLGLLFVTVMPPSFLEIVFIASFMWWIIAAVLVMVYPRRGQFWQHGVLVRAIMGLFTLVPCWLALNFIRHQSMNLYPLFFLFVLIWGADTFAYFVGRKWGKHKLLPLVSPGKTIEGLLGASVFALVYTGIIVCYLGASLVFTLLSMLAVLITVWFSIVGDLFESMLKRQVGIKDSSQILPGHGGLLDRIDSLTAAAPVFVLGALMLGLY